MDETMSKGLINTKELQKFLSCGRTTATKIGEEAKAKVKFGARVLWNVEKVKTYIDSISK